MFRRLASLFVAAILLSALPARATPISASDLLDPKLDYAADFSVSTGVQGTFRGTVIHAPGRERREFDTGMGREALILRRDIDQATMMWPERKWYVTTSFSAMSGMVGGFEDMMLDRKKNGTDIISGEVCSRYEVNGSSDEGGRFKGRMWFTRDDILMKASGTVRFQGKDTPVEMTLANLRRLKADPANFVLPSDYQGIPFDLSKFGLSGH